MNETGASALQEALDAVDRLSLEEQEAVIELIQRRLVARRRAQIACNAAATLQAVREGCAHFGSVEDLRSDLLAES